MEKSKFLGQTLLTHPTCENPIEKLKIFDDDFQFFCQMRKVMAGRFSKRNEDFQRQSFDRCMSCWVEKMYEEKPEQEKEMIRFLLFVNAEKSVYLKGPKECKQCQGPMPRGLNNRLQQIAEF